MLAVNDVLLIGASQGLLLSALLVMLRSENALANRLLALFIGFEALHLFWLFIIYSTPGEAPAAWIRLTFGFRLMGAPALYLYVRAMTDPAFRLRPRQLLLLLTLLPTIAWWAWLVSRDGWLQYAVVDLQRMPSTIALTVYVSLAFVVFGLLALRALRRHRQRLERTLSTTEHVDLWWLHWTIVLMVLVNLLGLSLDLLRLLQQIDAGLRVWINAGSTLIVVYLIALGGLRQPRVFTASIRAALAATQELAIVAGETLTKAADDTTKYHKSGVGRERIDEIWQQLGQLLERERPHLNPELDLPTLAQALEVKPQELSQTINMASGSSFYELINTCRVEEARRLLSDEGSRDRKLFDIALSSGFSNQSTFYSQFKKRTGMTPSAYRNRRSERSPNPSQRKTANN